MEPFYDATFQKEELKRCGTADGFGGYGCLWNIGNREMGGVRVPCGID